ncbi:hypothetical protein TU81_03625 [Pseudomonas lini]|nr:hypothetical protein TU81_03625 [Pseudomonas lini]
MSSIAFVMNTSGSDRGGVRGGASLQMTRGAGGEFQADDEVIKSALRNRAPNTLAKITGGTTASGKTAT